MFILTLGFLYAKGILESWRVKNIKTNWHSMRFLLSTILYIGPKFPFHYEPLRYKTRENLQHLKRALRSLRLVVWLGIDWTFLYIDSHIVQHIWYCYSFYIIIHGDNLEVNYISLPWSRSVFLIFFTYSKWHVCKYTDISNGHSAAMKHFPCYFLCSNIEIWKTYTDTLMHNNIKYRFPVYISQHWV